MNQEDKENKKYITIEGGLDFRKISKALSDNGFQMNHATARNQLISAMEKLLEGLVEEVVKDGTHNDEDVLKNSKSKTLVSNLLKTQDIHRTLGDLLQDLFYSEETEDTEKKIK